MQRLRPIWFVATLVVGALALAGTAHAQEVDYTNTVTVSAGAKVELEADIATITFGVRGSAEDATTATRRAARKTRSVVAALQAAGVTDDELTVSGASLNRRTDRRGRTTGYVATVTVKVKTQRLDDLGRIIDAGVSGGAGTVRLSYDVKDRRAAVDQALREAMTFARAKATSLAQADGREVGPVIVISEYNAQPPRAVSYDTIAAGSAEATYGTTIPLEPPTLSTQARISATFQLI